MELKRRITVIILLAIVAFYFITEIINLLQNKKSFVLSKYIYPPNAILWKFIVNHTQLSKNSSSCTPIKRAIQQVKYYAQSPYYYEYRYELHENQHMPSDESRLIILFGGRQRACRDWWDFSVGERILAKMRSSGFSILAICTKTKDYYITMPIQKNLNAYSIYTTLQLWMKDVYYKRFQHYPRLYLFGISQGSRMCSLMCRVLPVQAQILYVYPGYQPSLVVQSDHDRDMLNRLVLDFHFANWFYFDYCSRNKSFTSNRCPFDHSTKNYFNPVPPTYLIHAANDYSLMLSNYTKIMSDILQNAVCLGGTLLTHNQTMKLSIVHPLNITPDYMKENFDKWFCKPWSSNFFYELFINSTYKVKNIKSRTCWCMNRDFLYFTKHPNRTKTWSKSKQNRHYDYARDIHRYQSDLCQQICGDVLAHHAMISRHVNDTLRWLNDIDQYRSSYKIQEFLQRPLRIWIYNKSELVHNTIYLTYQTSLKTSCGREYDAQQMYSPEYFLQDYFERLKQSSPQSKHNFIWSKDPLLADYYIIPHDYACIAVAHYRKTLTAEEYRSFYVRLNQEYFLPLLTNVWTRFPYWNMTFGSNHLIAFTVGKNMAFIQDKLIEKSLKHVIQLGLTGFRQDLFPSSSLPFYIHRNITPIYRHNYDIVIPPFNRLQRLSDKPILVQYDWKTWYTDKKTLLFFTGTVNNSISRESIRQRLLSFVQNDMGENKTYRTKITIDGKLLNTIILIDGHLPRTNYIESIRSTIFHLCPEGFSPWSPRLYESITFGAIPLILAKSIVLPFERFVDWRSFSMKMNLNNMSNMIDFIMNISQFEMFVEQKLNNVTKYFHAFRWPYSSIDDKYDRHVFLPEEDLNGTARNVFHYLSLELRCRRLEQFYGLTADGLSRKSITAKQQACQGYPTICPC